MKSPQPDWVEALAHLSAADDKLAALIAQVGPCTLETPRQFDVFHALARSIVYQQLAGAAAAAIMGRVEALFPRRKPTPPALLEMPDAALRAAGLSLNKLTALRDLAAKCLDGTVPTRRAMAAMSDEEIVVHVSQVRGIGRWTVEMLLIFHLGRTNVLPVDDYGVRKGMQRLYRMRELPKKEAMQKRARKWHPWCSIASWYMWRCAELPSNKPAKKVAAKKVAAKKAPANKKSAGRKRPARGK